MATDAKQTEATTDPITAPAMSNTVALIGTIIAVVAVVLCGLMFLLASQLPSQEATVPQLSVDTPAQLRLLIVGCSTAVLAFVALILCVVGLFLPNRPRLLAAVGATVSLLLLLGVFGVLLIGAMLNPVQSPKTNAATAADSVPADNRQEEAVATTGQLPE